MLNLTKLRSLIFNQPVDSSCFAPWQLISTAQIKRRSWRSCLLSLVSHTTRPIITLTIPIIDKNRIKNSALSSFCIVLLNLIKFSKKNRNKTQTTKVKVQVFQKRWFIKFLHPLHKSFWCNPFSYTIKAANLQLYQIHTPLMCFFALFFNIWNRCFQVTSAKLFH